MSSEIFFFLFILCGGVTGLLAGLLGIGGGVITVPAIYYIFYYSGFLQTEVMQVAVSTSLAATFVTSSVSTIVQLQKKAVHFSLIKRLIPGLVLGCVLGALGAQYFPSGMLRILFGGMAILLGIYFFFPRLPIPTFDSQPNATLSLFGILIGTLSSLLGIGGGLFTVPVLIGYSIPMKNAVATSSASTLVTALIGSMAYLTIAWHQPEPPNTFGYIEIPTFLCIAIPSIFTTPLGVKLSHSLDTDRIKRIFAICLGVTGLSMLFL
ncbi:MAG: sulfite exporter TauE/SafE family protein [Chlamydiota bacterium]